MDWPQVGSALAVTLRKEQFMSPATVSPARAALALRRSPIPALRHLQVEETEQDVIVSGSVPSYYLKQLAQETLMPLVGDRQLWNRVLVVRS
jgi:hypothetical protein